MYILLCTEYVLQLYKHVLGMYLVCTASEPSFTGFQGVQHDANMQVPDAQQPAQDNDRDRGDPCPEDDQDFERPDAATMEEAISRFMDGMEAQERGGLNNLHGLLGRPPVPTAKASQAMTHKDALEGGFYPVYD